MFATGTQCDERQRNLRASVQTATAVQTHSDRLFPWRLYKAFMKGPINWKKRFKRFSFFVSVYIERSPLT